MLSKRLFSPLIYYQLILFFCFAVSINYFVELNYINLISYVIFHLTLIYLIFYHYHFSLYFTFFIYGIFYDLILINNIAPHLLCFLLFFVFINSIKKLFFKFDPIKISFVILIGFFTMLLIEMIIASTLYNLVFDFNNLGKLFIIGIIIYAPLLYFFSKIDNF